MLPFSPIQVIFLFRAFNGGRKSPPPLTFFCRPEEEEEEEDEEEEEEEEEECFSWAAAGAESFSLSEVEKELLFATTTEN